jgi:hypothetical protein
MSHYPKGKNFCGKCVHHNAQSLEEFNGDINAILHISNSDCLRENVLGIQGILSVKQHKLNWKLPPKDRSYISAAFGKRPTSTEPKKRSLVEYLYKIQNPFLKTSPNVYNHIITRGIKLPC